MLTKRQRPYKPSTIRGFRGVCGSASSPTSAPSAACSEIRRSDVQDLVDRLLGKGENPSTIRNTLDPLRAIFRWAEGARTTSSVNPTARGEGARR